MGLLKKNVFFSYLAASFILLGCHGGTKHDKGLPPVPPGLTDGEPQKELSVEFPTFETTPEEVQASTNSAIALAEIGIERIVQIPDEQLTFTNTFVQLDEFTHVIENTTMRLSLIENTNEVEAVRDAAFEAGQELSKWFVGLGFNANLYKKLLAYSQTSDAKAKTGEDKLLIEKTLEDFERNGLALSEDLQAELKQLNERLVEVTSKISKNITDDAGKISLTKDELAGAPEAFLNSIKDPKTPNVYTISTKLSDQVRNAMESVTVEETRKKILITQSSRAKEVNRELIQETLQLRAKIASLLGFNNWADYQIAPKLAKNAANATEFLDQLASRLETKFNEEKEELKALKGGEINAWDTTFYLNMLRKEKYQVNTEQLRVYFPMEQTLQGMFDIYSKVFALKVKEVEPPYKWTKELRAYEISDGATGENLGLLYMDLYPREGKYGHFASFGVRNGRNNQGGKNLRPVNSLVCNFPTPEEGKPSLLTYDQVLTAFHEFGHGIHDILSKTKYFRFAGTSVARDFVESPSQVLERWPADPAVLDTFAADYRDSSKKIPKDILAQIRKAELGTVGHDYRRQLSFGRLDLAIHSYGVDEVPSDIYPVVNKILGDVFYPVPDETAFIAGFGHLFGGYDAGYYGYAWADAISADLSAVFENAPNKFFDVETGLRLRREIFEKGSSRDENESITAFLGRPWNSDAFFKWLGLEK